MEEKSALIKKKLNCACSNDRSQTIKNLYCLHFFLALTPCLPFMTRANPSHHSQPAPRSIGCLLKSSQFEKQEMFAADKQTWIYCFSWASHPPHAARYWNVNFVCHETNLSNRKPKCFIANSFLSGIRRERLFALLKHHHHLHIFFSGLFLWLR